ncbi:Spy/CpxP family protein refolding chaperone [Bradyrhizobium sp.]|uniref:Spy/CpxP family protein refolding chaperone n=1 Tax=Bradyrhizobium sp. TaxID=376 RepID=UPI003C227461
MMIPKERLSRLCISQPKVKWSAGTSSCSRCNTTDVGTSTLIVASAAFAATLTQVAVAQGGSRHAPFERLCAERGGPSHHPEMADRIAEYLNLSDAQKAAFKEFHEARRQSLEDSKAALCASKPDMSSFEARLNFGQAFIEARLAALKAENPKLIAFYNSLDAKQKEKFDRFRERHGRE